MTPEPDPSVTGNPDAPAAAPPLPLASTVRQVLADAKGLMWAEVQLARLETAGKAAVAGSALVRIAIGAAFLMLALIFGTVALVVALADAIGLLWALVAVAGGTAAIGLMLLLIGRKALVGFSLLPKQAMARISADIDYMGDRAEARQAAVQEPASSG